MKSRESGNLIEQYQNEREVPRSNLIQHYYWKKVLTASLSRSFGKGSLMGTTSRSFFQSLHLFLVSERCIERIEQSVDQ